MTDGRGSKVATAQYCRMEQKEACYGKSNRRCLINKEGSIQQNTLGHTIPAVKTKVNSLDAFLKVCALLPFSLNRDELIPNPAIHFTVAK